jgi:hypothetical protein
MNWIPSQAEIRTVPSHALTSVQTAWIIELCSEVFRLDYAFYMTWISRAYTSWATPATAWWPTHCG